MVLAIVSVGSVMASPVSAATTHNIAAGSTSAQIQAMIDMASSGDTISFAPGTYNNIKVNINKTLSLVGNGAVINGVNESGTVIFTISADAENADGSGTTVQGFEFNLLNNTMNGSTGYAIKLNKVSNIAINNVTSHNGKSAVYSSQASNVLVQNCTFDDQYNTAYGVNIMGGNNITVKKSTIIGGVDGVSMASGAANISVINNSFLNNAYGAFWGGGISNITFANNLFNNWSVEGLAIEKAANLTSVVNNTFVNGTGDAIYIQNSNAHGAMTVISGIEIIQNMFKNILGAAIGIDKSGIFNASGTGDSIVGVNNTVDNVSKGYVNLYSTGKNLNFTMDSSYPQTVPGKANISVSSGVSSSAIKTGDKTTYTITIKNNGNSNATNVKVSNILKTDFYSSYATYSSLGTYSNGVWNIGNLSAGNTASLVITATALKSGVAISQAKATADTGITALSNTIQKTINKYIKMSYSNLVSSSKVKTGKYVYLTSTISNSGKDRSNAVKVKITLPKGMKLIAVNYPSVYNKSTKTWTFTVPAGKAYSFKVKAQVTSKGLKKVIFNINGKTWNKYITGY